MRISIAKTTPQVASASSEAALHAAVTAEAMDVIRREGPDSVQRAIASLLLTLADDSAAIHESVLTLMKQADQCYSPGAIRNEILHQAHEQLGGFDLNTASKDGRTALDLAVAHDDRDFARNLLDKGADPKRVRIPTTVGMRELLTSFRWKNLLYPPGGHQDKPHGGSPLDQALMESRRDQAKELLDHRMKGRDLCSAWIDAVRNNERDFLRAVLLLSPPADLQKLSRRFSDSKPAFQSALQQALTLGDPGLSAAIKEFPYQSPRRARVDYLNGAANFAATGNEIVCRHLSTHQLEQQALHPQNKFDWKQFGTVAAISRHVDPTIENTFQALKLRPLETHMVSNAQFGKFLHKQFDAMERKNEASRLMLVNSVNHAMNLCLRIKSKGGEKSYVVKFYDPNYTTNLARSRANSAQAFEDQSLQSYVPESDMEDYFPQAYRAAELEFHENIGNWTHAKIDAYMEKAKGASMVYVRPNDNGQEDALPPAGSGSANRLTSCMAADEMEPDAVTLLMQGGFAENVLQLRSRLPALSENQQVRLLGTPDSFGHPPLYVAMENNHGEAIKAFGQLLAELPKSCRFSLLEAKATDDFGDPALFNALCEGKHESVRAYRDLLASLLDAKDESRPEKRQRQDSAETQASQIRELTELVACKDKWDTPVLHVLMQRKSPETVNEYGELLKLLPPERQGEMLLAFDSENKSGIRAALNAGRWDTVTRYLDLVDTFAHDLPPNDVAALRRELANSRGSLTLKVRSDFSKFQETYQRYGEVSCTLDALIGQASASSSARP